MGEKTRTLTKAGGIVFALFSFLPYKTLRFLFNLLAPDGNFAFLTLESVVFFRFLFFLLGTMLFVALSVKRAWRKYYGLLIAFIYGIIFSAQVLGLLKIYRLYFVLPAVVVLTGLIYWIYNRYFIKEILGSDENSSRTDLLNTDFGIMGLILIVFLLLVPVIIFPYSPISPTLNWDVGKYHLPKALELVSTGSAWDMTISYGAYPFGYESLFSFAAILTRNGYLFGSAQALGNLFFVFTLWFLMRRYTRLPEGILLFFSALFTTGWVLFQGAHLWRIFNLPIYSIGKNDLFLAASVLAVILHSPIGTKENERIWYPLGMALTSMIAFSVKPNALMIIAPIWLWSLYLYWRKKTPLPFFELAGWALLMLPGVLWILRNLIKQGTIFYDEILVLQRLSILNNLGNPDFYQHLPPEIFMLLVILFLALWGIFQNTPITWSLWLTYLLLFLGFIATPATAFVHNLEEDAYISWRFGIALLVFAFLLLIILFEPWIRRGYSSVLPKKFLRITIAALLIFSTLFGIWRNRWNFYPTLEYLSVLEDPYPTPVGTDGYRSALDYVHKNIRNSVVQIENGLPYYVYGTGFTNSTTLTRKADFTVILKTNWLTKKILEYPDKLDEETWLNNWQLVYEDPEGRVYRHR